MTYTTVEACFRPRKQGSNPKTPLSRHLTLRLTEQESILLDALAARLDTSAANALRHLASQGLTAMNNHHALDGIDITPPRHGVARDLYRSRR